MCELSSKQTASKVIPHGRLPGSGGAGRAKHCFSSLFPTFEVELGPLSSQAHSVSNFKEFATEMRAAVVFMAGLRFFVFFLDSLH